MTPGNLKNGDHVKVHLPGEWPWAIVIAIIAPNVIQARLDNTPVCRDSHSFKYGDVLTFQYRDTPQAPGYFAWEVSPDREQLPVGPQKVEKVEVGPVPSQQEETP